jgi:hypothetical protein
MTVSSAFMRLTQPLPSRTIVVAILGVIALVAGLAALTAQVTGDRGIAPVASSSDIDVTGIEVDVRGDTAEEARAAGWRKAQRDAWAKIGGPDLPDSQIDGMVSAIVIERELIGPRRYRASLGVIFDRNRAGQYLGGGSRGRSSAPMLLLPVTASAGTYTMYEVRNPWQRAWAEFNPGTSRINYVRPAGAGGDSLLLNHGQSMRRSRTIPLLASESDEFSHSITESSRVILPSGTFSDWDSDEVLEALAHLEALDVEVPAVQEVVHPLLASLDLAVRNDMAGPG